LSDKSDEQHGGATASRLLNYGQVKTGDES